MHPNFGGHFGAQRGASYLWVITAKDSFGKVTLFADAEKIPQVSYAISCKIASSLTLFLK